MSVVERERELMLPELEHLAQNEIFSKAEIQRIVKTRLKHESATRKNLADLASFQRYIDYEKSLECSRLARQKMRGVHHKRGVSDFSIRRRISRIYRRALRLFPEQFFLHAEYINYLVSLDSLEVASRAVAAMVQLHPGKPEAWLIAARWEVLCNGNLRNARKLMLQAVRVNDHDRNSWLGLMEVELMCSERLKDMEIREQAKRTGVMEGFIKFPDERDDSDGDERKDDVGLPEDPRFKDHSLWESALDLNSLPIIIYNHAKKATPNDLDLRIMLYQQVESKEWASGARDRILEAILQEFPDSPRAFLLSIQRRVSKLRLQHKDFPKELVDTLARFRAFIDGSQESEAADCRQLKIEVSDSFLSTLHNFSKEGPEIVRNFLARVFHDIFTFLTDRNLTNPGIFLTALSMPRISTSSLCGDREVAQDIVNIGIGKHPRSAALWTRKIEMEPDAFEPATKLFSADAGGLGMLLSALSRVTQDARYCQHWGVDTVFPAMAVSGTPFEVRQSLLQDLLDCTFRLLGKAETVDFARRVSQAQPASWPLNPILGALSQLGPVEPSDCKFLNEELIPKDAEGWRRLLETKMNGFDKAMAFVKARKVLGETAVVEIASNRVTGVG